MGVNKLQNPIFAYFQLILFSIRNEHSYARTSTGLTTSINPKHTKASFPCSNCPYVAKRKGTLDDHEKFHCPNRTSPVKKEAICKFCQKYFTHNGLRHHLNGLANAARNGRRPKGKHCGVKTVEFLQALKEVKLR